VSIKGIRADMPVSNNTNRQKPIPGTGPVLLLSIPGNQDDLVGRENSDRFYPLSTTHRQTDATDIANVAFSTCFPLFLGL